MMGQGVVSCGVGWAAGAFQAADAATGLLRSMMGCEVGWAADALMVRFSSSHDGLQCWVSCGRGDSGLQRGVGWRWSGNEVQCEVSCDATQAVDTSARLLRSLLIHDVPQSTSWAS